MDDIGNSIEARPALEILTFIEALARQLAREDSEAALVAQVGKGSDS